MNWFIYTYMAALVVAMVFLARNELVYRVRNRRIKEISRACQRDLRRTDFYELLDRRYGELDAVSYNAMLFQFTRWTYRQFYPQEVA